MVGNDFVQPFAHATLRHIALMVTAHCPNAWAVSGCPCATFHECLPAAHSGSGILHGIEKRRAQGFNR